MNISYCSLFSSSL